MEKLLCKRRLQNLLFNNPEASEDDIEHVKSMRMNKNLRRHYNVIVEFSAAIRILCNQLITPNDTKRGGGALSRSVQEWARMGCHLTPYYHLAQHIPDQLLRTGPSYASSAWAYERNNGFLGRFKHNGHSGGEIEGTMFRGWWKTIFIQDLVCTINCFQLSH
jgi:hypothetical protein